MKKKKINENNLNESEKFKFKKQFENIQFKNKESKSFLMK